MNVHLETAPSQLRPIRPAFTAFPALLILPHLNRPASGPRLQLEQELTTILIAGVLILIGLILMIAFFFWVRARSRAVRSQVSAGEPASTPVTLDDNRKTEPVLPVIETVDQPDRVPASGQRPGGIGWQIAGLSDVGLKRELNEDSYIMIEDEMGQLGPYGIYAVADGLGGHEAGEVASQLTIEAIQSQYSQNPPTASAAPFNEWLKDVVMAANESVLNHQHDSPEKGKMGSTLVLALIADHKAHIVNVGDSRAYHLTTTGITQITEDHSVVERLVQIGQISREEARTHRHRNVVYSIIGEKQKLEVGYFHISLAGGDRLLLCSDGLSGMVSDEELLKISTYQADPGTACQMMIEAAKNAGGKDNITAILIQLEQ